MALIQVDIDADAVIEAMTDDVEFALQMWLAIAVGLDKGMLKDDAIYIINGLGPLDRTVVTGNFKDLTEHLRP